MSNGSNTGPNPPTSGPQDAGSGNDKGDKLIAGKFKTIEEAVEQGYIGLEKGYHELGEKVAALVQVIESAMTPPADNPGQPPVDTGRDTGAGGTDPYGRNQGTVDAADFLTNPTKHLDERDARLEQRIGKVVSDVVSNALAVNDFKSQNPDLVKHEKLIKAFMPETDSRKPVKQRLEDAGKLAREYLAKVKADGQNPGANPPTGGDHVEAPRGGNPPGKPPEQDTPEDDEAELAEYIRERHANMASHFGAPQK